MEQEEEGTFPSGGQRNRLVKTAIINLSLLVGLGLLEAGRGPTLLDLRDIYGTTVDKISFMFLISSVGSVIGCFFIGCLMERYPDGHDLILFAVTASGGLLSCLYPVCGRIQVFFAVVFACGFMYGAIDAGGNIMCLHLWRGLNGGPYLHSIHFSFSFGAFLSPLLAAPFLSSKGSFASEADDDNVTAIVEDDDGGGGGGGGGNDSRIWIYFLAAGSATVLISLGYLHFGISGMLIRRKGEEEKAGLKATATGRNRSEVRGENADAKTSGNRRSANFVAFVSLVCLFFFSYVGVEYLFGMYLTTFVASSRHLGATKLDGTRVAAVFWGSFSAMRLLAVFLAVRMDPLATLASSFAVCIAASVALLFWAEHSLFALQICVGVMGLGMAPVYAAGMLWAERFTPVTGMLGALFTLSAATGPDIFPILVGQRVESDPAFMIRLTGWVVVACVLLFAASYPFGNRVKREAERAAAETSRRNGEDEDEEQQEIL